MKPEHWAALRDGVVASLEAGIDAGGSSIDDYRDGRGEKGQMQERFLVHTREGEPCPLRGARLVTHRRLPAAPPTSARAAR